MEKYEGRVGLVMVLWNGLYEEDAVKVDLVGCTGFVAYKGFSNIGFFRAMEARVASCNLVKQ